MLSLFFHGGIPAFGQTPAVVSTVVVSWSPNNEDDLVGYRVYYRLDDTTYALIREIGPVTSSVDIDLPHPGHRHWFTVTALNIAGMESEYSDEAEVSNNRPANHAPTVTPQPTATTPVNTPVRIAVIASDDDEDPLTFKIALEPKYGTVSLSGSTVVYTPEPGFSGRDRFSVRAFDGRSYSASTRINVEVMPEPAVALSFARIGTLPVMTLQWNTTFGRRYQILSASDPKSTVWTPEGPDFTAQTTVLIRHQLIRTDRPALFFRVVELPD